MCLIQLLLSSIIYFYCNIYKKSFEQDDVDNNDNDNNKNDGFHLIKTRNFPLFLRTQEKIKIVDSKLDYFLNLIEKTDSLIVNSSVKIWLS